jgi:hypothetical protein
MKLQYDGTQVTERGSAQITGLKISVNILNLFKSSNGAQTAEDMQIF